MDILRGVLDVRRIDKMRNERIRERCGVKKGVNERINESMLRWFGHVERMNDSRLVKRMYSVECVGNRPAGRPKRKWIESVNECLKERNVSLAEARIKVHDRRAVSYTHLRAHETPEHLVCRLLLEKKKTNQ